MARTSVKVSGLGKLQKFLKRLKKPVDGKTAKKIGKETVVMMKSSVSKGLSPIKSRGRFKAYKKSYKDRITRSKMFGKKLKPVNLKLSGTFLKQLTFKVRRGKFGSLPEIGFFKSYGIDLEQGHREGQNNQEKRPIIPDTSSNENFSVKITQMIRKEIKKAIDSFKKKS